MASTLPTGDPGSSLLTARSPVFSRLITGAYSFSSVIVIATVEVAKRPPPSVARIYKATNYSIFTYILTINLKLVYFRII